MIQKINFINKQANILNVNIAFDFIYFSCLFDNKY